VRATAGRQYPVLEDRAVFTAIVYALTTGCAWLTSYRRLTLRYRRWVRLFTAFLSLVTIPTCYKKLAT
jgi:transposase